MVQEEKTSGSAIRQQGYQYLFFSTQERTVDLFGELVDLFLDFKKPRIKESSLYTFKWRISKHILPFFGHRKLLEITPLDIVEWQACMPPMSERSILELRHILGSIFRFGEQHFGTPNPLELVPYVRISKQKRKMQVWSKEEFEKFDAVADEQVYRCLFRLLYFSGCRKGEALALAPLDIDEKRSIISITKSYTRKCFDAPYKIDEPKTLSSYRNVEIPPILISELLSLQQDRNAPFLFGGSSPLSESTITRKFKQWTLKAGVKPIRIHDLRHSHASLLISSGVSPVAVSKRLGHASVTETLDTYSHVMPQDNEMIMRLLE